MYCIYEFSKTDVEEWQYVIWKIKKIGKSAGGLLKYVCIKKIYDPMNRFKVGDVLSKPSIFKNERKVILRIFEGMI